MDLSQFKDMYDSVGGMDGIKNGVSSVSGFFSKKKDKASKESPKTNVAPSPQAGMYSPELERLIEMILEDDEVTDRELEMLAARAEKEGVDPFEFELTIKKRLRQKREYAERMKNPVAAMAEAFKMAEAAAKGGETVVGKGALSSALALIPGVGGVAAIGGLAASLIKTPSNLNSLKAEIISHAQIPEEEGYLVEFMMFCHTQKELEIERRQASSYSVSQILSTITVGSSVDLMPIWTTKINQLISRARALYPNSESVRNAIATVYESPATRLRKVKSNDPIAFYKELEGLTAPEDNKELLEVIGFLYMLSNDDEDAKEKHKSLYKVAESRFAGNDELLRQLKTYKIKRFGLF